MKAFFSELPEPLVPYSMQGELVEAFSKFWSCDLRGSWSTGMLGEFLTKPQGVMDFAQNPFPFIVTFF